MTVTVDSRAERENGRALDLKLFGLLIGASALAILGVVPYQLSLLGTTIEELGVSLPVLLLLSLVQGLILVAVVTALGLWLGNKIDLGARDLRGWLAGDAEARAWVRGYILPAIIAGALAGAAILVLEGMVFAPRMEGFLASGSEQAAQNVPPWWTGLLASFYGGIVEELLLRLGVMTVIAWIGAKVTRVEKPGPAVMWSAIFLAALLFGLGHLPTVAAIMPLNTLTISRILLLNGIGGLVFGWLYWRRGLGAAIIAHFTADIVLHVLAAGFLS